MKKTRLFSFLTVFVACIFALTGCISTEPEKELTAPSISLDKTEYALNENIVISYQDTNTEDWIGIYPEGSEPGTMNAPVWNYCTRKGVLNFNTSDVGAPGTYWVFLCDDDGYNVLDMTVITILDGDTNDYGAADATVNATVENGYSHIEVSVMPSSEAKLTYRFYWSKGEERLAGYEPIYTVEEAGGTPFTAVFNDCLFMPDEADGIEVAVTKGRSRSVFAPAPETLKVPTSNLLYKFNVITDLHIISMYPQHSSHLNQALNDIIKQGDSTAIFTVGDNTERGTIWEYDLLMDIIKNAGKLLPDMYFAIGNHDVVFSNNEAYDEKINLFKEKTGMPGAYYSVTLNDTPFIVLGSDTSLSAGTVGREELEWLKAELAKANKERPIFLFLHQPLVDTVSGTLYSQDEDIQDWYGITESADEIRSILKEYSNAFLFSGHTHWTLESKQPILPGRGTDATFINCAAVGYLWNDDDVAVGGSEGYYVEVYEDFILLRGREFMKGNWCAAAQFLIPIT